ncbi:MAG: DUF1842 domain-containing protein [Chloroflexota bacterium]
MSYNNSCLHYRIGTKTLGAVQFNVALVINEETKTVHGSGRITQSTNPPVNIQTTIDGKYNVIRPRSSIVPIKVEWVAISAEGYTTIPIHGPQIPSDMPQPKTWPSPIKVQNVRLFMWLTNWESGLADFSYIADGKQHDFKDVPVELIKD